MSVLLFPNIRNTLSKENPENWAVIRGVARGQGGQPCSRNAHICNKIDALEGIIEIAGATALCYLEKGVSLYPKGCFPNI